MNCYSSHIESDKKAKSSCRTVDVSLFCSCLPVLNLYEVPFSCLYGNKVKNLFTAGTLYLVLSLLIVKYFITAWRRHQLKRCENDSLSCKKSKVSTARSKAC